MKAYPRTPSGLSGRIDYVAEKDKPDIMNTVYTKSFGRNQVCNEREGLLD